jgi:hypothetical protein
VAIGGRYDFKGIKKLGSAGVRAALLSNPSTAFLVKVPFFNALIEMLLNWLTNNGLILLNIGAIYVNGEIDQKVLDRAIDEGIKRVELSGAKLTPKQIKEIDDAVIRAADKFLPYGSKPR